MKSTLKDYEKWKIANQEGEFSIFDYVHAVLPTGAAGVDLLIAIARMTWPQFLEIDGLVLLAEQCSAHKLAQFRRQGLADADIEFWTNLLSVDGMLAASDAADRNHEEELASILVAAWRAKLHAEFPTRSFFVRVVRDEDAGDICVVFTQSR